MTYEPDHNHPDHPDKKLVEAIKTIRQATHVDVKDGDVLIIEIPNDDRFPPQKWDNVIKSAKERFQEVFPDTKIIVTPYRMKFTTISKKTAFHEKLKGTVV